MAKKEKAKKKPEQRSEMLEKKILSIIEEKGDKYARSNRRLEMSMDKLEGKTTMIFGGIIVVGIVIIVFAVFGLHKVSKLDSRIEALKEAQSKFEQAKDNESNYETYLDAAFPTNGKIYEVSDATFYSDPNCENKLQNVKFISMETQMCKDEDGHSVNAYRMANDQICYSRYSVIGFTQCK